MPTFHYAKTHTYYVAIEADTQEQADELVNDVLTIDDEVNCAEGSWERDDYESLWSTS